MSLGNDAIVKYIFEAGMLKRTARSGWWAENIKNPESVGDHSFRTAIIAFFLARLEGADPNKLASAAVFHDMVETRIGDMNKITARYIDVDERLERKVRDDQIQGMPSDLQDSLLKTLDLSEKEHTILKDADYLECAFQAKEYADAGAHATMRWVSTIGGKLRTSSAKKLHARLTHMDSNSWWKGLKKLE